EFPACKIERADGGVVEWWPLVEARAGEPAATRQRDEVRPAESLADALELPLRVGRGRGAGPCVLRFAAGANPREHGARRVKANGGLGRIGHVELGDVFPREAVAAFHEVQAVLALFRNVIERAI